MVFRMNNGQMCAYVAWEMLLCLSQNAILFLQLYERTNCDLFIDNTTVYLVYFKCLSTDLLRTLSLRCYAKTRG